MRELKENLIQISISEKLSSKLNVAQDLSLRSQPMEDSQENLMTQAELFQAYSE